MRCFFEGRGQVLDVAARPRDGDVRRVAQVLEGRLFRRMRVDVVVDGLHV